MNIDLIEVKDGTRTYKNPSVKALVGNAKKGAYEVIDSPNISVTANSLKESLKNGNKYYYSGLSEHQIDAACALIISGQAKVSEDKSGFRVLENKTFHTFFHGLTFGAFLPR